MAMRDDPVGYLDRVIEAYKHVGSGTVKVLRDETLIFAARGIAAQADPTDYGDAKGAFGRLLARKVLRRPAVAEPVGAPY